MSKRVISRREFTRDSASLIIGFSIAGTVAPVVSWMPAAPERSSPRSLAPEHLDSWLAIDEDSFVTVYTGRIDMGTGVETAFAQVVADELDIPFRQIRMLLGDTGLTPDQAKSTGSNNMSSGVQPLRVAAAEARWAMIRMAADHFRVPIADVTARDGFLEVRGDTSKRISFGALMKARRFDHQMKVVNDQQMKEVNDPPELAGVAPLKGRRQYVYVGKSVPRVDVPPKAYGSFKFVQDVRVPEMLHGRVVRPQSVGAALVEVDEQSVRHISTLVKVVRRGDFLGVVAEREEHAVAAARALKARWEKRQDLPEQRDLYTATRNSPLLRRQVRLDVGDVDAALPKARRTLEATYYFPMQLHAMLGPSCAVADVRPDGVTVWSGTQWPQGTRADLAKMLGFPLDRVRVIWVEASGSYGRLSCDDAAADAALLSQAVGKPVRVQWMRHDEHGWEPVSPAMVMEVRVGLNDDGSVAAWRCEQWSASHAISERGNFLAWRLMGTAPGWERLSSSPGVYSYVFPNTRQIANYVTPILRTIYLRAPGRIQHNFASESFMDEVALAAGVDPIEYRLHHLRDPNAISLIRTVTREAAWEPRTAPRKRQLSRGVATGQGFAFGEHSQGQQIALVVDVTVDLETARIRVPKIVSASQCGLIINPEGLKHQVQGAIIQGASRSLMEELKVTPASVSSLDWSAYPIMKFSEVPTVEVTLIDQPDTPSSGVGETATIPVAAAIANAIFDATGFRLRQVPLQPELLKFMRS